MTSTERVAFRNYFGTAMLTGGLAMAMFGAVAGWRSFGAWWGAPVGFALGLLYVAPLAALLVYLKVLVDRRAQRAPGPQRTRVIGALIVGLGIAAVVVIGGLLLRGYGR